MKETKTCTKCGRELPVSEYYKSKRTGDGLHAWCKKCVCKSSNDAKKKRKEQTLCESNMCEPAFSICGFNLTKIEEEVIKTAIRFYRDLPMESVAKALNISPRTMSRKLVEYGIVLDDVRQNSSYDVSNLKTIDDYEPRELLKALWNKGYDGHFFTYVKQEMSLSKLFGSK